MLFIADYSPHTCVTALANHITGEQSEHFYATITEYAYRYACHSAIDQSRNYTRDIKSFVRLRNHRVLKFSKIFKIEEFPQNLEYLDC